MKLILTQQTVKLGDKGDIVEVKDGYALNFLIPSGQALPTTKDNIKKIIKQKMAESAKKKEVKEKEIKERKEKKSKREKRMERKQAEETAISKIKYQKSK